MAGKSRERVKRGRKERERERELVLRNEKENERVIKYLMADVKSQRKMHQVLYS